MASVLPQQLQQQHTHAALGSAAATDKLLESFGLAERGEHAFLVEEAGGAVAFTAVFLQEEEDGEDHEEEGLMLQRLQDAIAGSSTSSGSSGSTSTSGGTSSSASSDSGAGADGEGDGDGDGKDACE